VILAAGTPDVVGHLEADDKNAAVQLSGALSQRVHSVISVERAMLLRIEIRRIVEILTFALAHCQQMKSKSERRNNKRKQASVKFVTIQPELFLHNGLTQLLRLHLDLLHFLPRLVLLLVQILEQVFLPLDLSVDVADAFLNVGLCLGKILLDQGRPD
jgi:hypothetical protein